MNLSFLILAALVYSAIAYVIVTKMIIPVKQLWLKIFDSVVLAGVGAAIVYGFVKYFGG
jgi:uncharacterized protein YqhQ